MHPKQSCWLQANSRATKPPLRCARLILPTEWRAAPLAYISTLESYQPDAALKFGVSDKASGLVIETLARNRADRADAADTHPSAERLNLHGPSYAKSRLPARRIVKALRRAGYPAQRSRDAGSYLCNGLLYHTLQHRRRQSKPALAGFIHLPATLSEAATGRPADLSFDDAIDAVVLLVELVANELAQL